MFENCVRCMRRTVPVRCGLVHVNIVPQFSVTLLATVSRRHISDSHVHRRNFFFHVIPRQHNIITLDALGFALINFVHDLFCVNCAKVRS